MRKPAVVTLGALVLGALASPVALYFYRFNGPLASKAESWEAFGAYIGGIFGTLAFFVLAYTTNITRKQFQVQNESSIFFKLYDALQDRIINAVTTIEEVQRTGREIPRLIANEFQTRLSVEAIQIARHLLCRDPESISQVQYHRLFEAIKGPSYLRTYENDKTKFIEEIKSRNSFDDRWEFLKVYVGSGDRNERIAAAMKTIGAVYFYKVPYDERRNQYERVLGEMYQVNGDFLDGYFKGIRFLVSFANKCVDRRGYIEFIKSQLTNYELVVIFYLVAGRSGELGDMKGLHTLGIMEGLLTQGCGSLMLDSPSNKELQDEISFVFAS